MKKTGKMRLIRKRKGTVLPLAILMVVILTLVGLALIRLGLNARMEAVRTTGQISARAAADAGMIEAVDVILSKWFDRPTWTNTQSFTSDTVYFQQSFGNSRFSYAVDGNDPRIGYDVTSTGTAGDIVRQIHTKVVLKSFWVGVAVKGGVAINVGAAIGMIPADSDFIIRTNSIEEGAVELKMGVIIPGDVIVGPGGDPDVVIDTKADVEITGQTFAADEPLDFPSVEVPSYPPGTWVVDVNDPTVARITGPDVQWSGPLNIGSPSPVDTLYVDGDPSVNGGQVRIYVDGTTILSAGGKLVVTEGTYLKLYLAGDLLAKNGSEITVEGVTESSSDEVIDAAVHQIKIFGTPACTFIKLYNSGSFFGAIYAPDAELDINNSGNLYGAFVGSDNLQLRAKGSFYYVPSLLNADDVEPSYLGIKKGSWWEE